MAGAGLFCTMNLLEQLYSAQVWNEYLAYKTASGHLSKEKKEDLIHYVYEKQYIPTVRRIESGEPFNPPEKKIISKHGSNKKRVVYIYSREENNVLKLLTFLLIRKYDSIFSPNLYSFRKNHGVRRAIEYLKQYRNLSGMYVYKADIHDYFNSVDIALLIPMLESIMFDEPVVLRFVISLLVDSRVRLPDGSIVEERKGIMAGVPLASFLANVYLHEMDSFFFENGNNYFRYSDDIIVFSKGGEESYEAALAVRRSLGHMHLTINEKKESFSAPHEKWEFLGISFQDNVFDVSKVSADKLKKKMRRKSRALDRWKDKKGLENECAAKAFIRIFNNKLYCNSSDNELTWTRWFFPMINTAATLSEIDRYMQDCIRYLATGRRTAGRYRFRYEDMKRLGYRSLVHEYYEIKKSASSSDS